MAMLMEELIARIERGLPGAAVDVEGADCNFTVTVISDVFTGLMPVKRQQRVLDAFTDVLANGTLHALTIKAFTPQEWEAKQSGGLVQIGL
ncbi:MAG: BolA/IbaG family iron-sulfur metabolism protein [Spongiibacteraceae bacterium]